MPLPSPKDDEKENDFIARCIPLVIEDQGLDKDDEGDRAQAVAICYSQFRKKERSDSMADKLEGRIGFTQWVSEKLGLEEKVTAVRNAFYAKFDPRQGGVVGVPIQAGMDVWITEPIQDDHVVVQMGGQDDVYRIDYTMDDEGNVEFGEPQKGEMVFNPTEAEDSPEKRAQKARATKYGIGIKPGGNVTRPSAYEDVPESAFADPTNFRYPLQPQARAINAVVRFNDTTNEAAGGYTDEEWAKMGRRIAKANGEGYSYDSDSKKIVTPSTQESVRESIRISETTRTFEQEEPEGKVWLVTIIKAGLSMNGNYYPPDVLEAAVPVFEGVQVFDNHLTDEEWAERRKHRNVNREYMGWIDDVFYADEALQGHFHVADIVLREKMKTVWEGGRKNEFGFSIDAGVEAEKREVDGKQVNYISKFLDRDSVDVVFDPSAGGRMERMLEQRRGGQNVTIEELEKVLEGMGEEERQAVLAKFAPPAVEDQAPPPAVEDQTAVPAVGDQTPPPAAEDQTPPPVAGDQTPLPAAGTMQDATMAEARKKIDAIDLKLYQVDLKEALAASNLPNKAREFIWDQFKGRVCDVKDVRGAIEAQRGILATVTSSGQVQGMGGIRLSAGPVVEVSGFEYALERMLGVLAPENKDKVPVGLFGLREWYQALTGDYDWKGQVAPHRVTEANVTTATVTSVVKNVLNKRILALYESAVSKRWWEPVVTHYDEDTINDVTVYQTYGIGELPTVPEGDAYTEASWGDYEETASFAKKGRFIGVTLETFMRDNLNALRRLPDALNRAWLYTIQSAVSGLFTANSGEGAQLATTIRNWFNATEANLGSGAAYALSYATFDAAQVAIFNMTEAGSSEPLGIFGKYLLVASANRGLAIQIRDSEKDPDAANNPVNVWQGQFEVIVVPKWSTNTSRWYLLADPSDAPLIGLHWFRGKRVPELFQAESETTGAMFTNDVMRWKIRDWFAISLADHRGAYGGVPA